MNTIIAKAGKAFWLFTVVLFLFTALPLDYAIAKDPHKRNESGLEIESLDNNFISVNTLDDELNADGDCSLREAITAANTNAPSDKCAAGKSDTVDTLIFLLNGTITLTKVLPEIKNAGPVIIDGGNHITISGDHQYRVFEVGKDARTTIQNLSVINGYVSCCSSIGSVLNGGSLFNKGTLEINNSTFIGNAAEGSGGALYSVNGLVNINNSIFSNNKSNNGGALSLSGGLVTINESAFYENGSLDTTSGSEFGGAISSNSTLHITGSTFSNNQTGSNGGALWITVSSNALIENSTFSGNQAKGIYGQGGAVAVDNNSKVIINNSTITGNSAKKAGGAISVGLGSVSIKNSIVAFSQYIQNCSGKITDGGNNLDSGASCGFLIANNSSSNSDPLLAALNDNGGPTQTHALQLGSPAINAANCSTGTPTDQRGIERPQELCDIGSYESTSYPFVMVKNDSYVTLEDTSLIVQSPGFLWNDVNQDRGSLTVSSLPVHGALTQNYGSFEYLPESNYFGTDSFAYTIAIGDHSEIAEVFITIYPVDDPAEAYNDAVIVSEDTPWEIPPQDLLNNDVDLEGNPLTITEFSSPIIGEITQAAGGVYTYTPRLNYFGSDMFTYKMSDGFSVHEAAVSLTITPVNDVPVAQDDTYTVRPGVKLVVPAPGILRNDNDIENDSLSASIVTTPLNGTLVFNLDGSFSYVSDPGFTGKDTFKYIVHDSNGSSNQAVITLNVEWIRNYLPNFIVN